MNRPMQADPDEAREDTAPRGPRKRRKAPTDRRQDLLEVAISCLARLGPRAATGREICRRAGVSHGLLRHYFESPEALFLAAYEDLCARFLAEFEQQLGTADADPWRTLEGFFERLFSEAWASPDVLGAWTGFWTLTRTDPAFAAVNASYNQSLRTLLERAAGRLAGFPAAELGRADASAILASVMDGLWLECCLNPGPDRRARAVALCRTTLRLLAEA